jgi:hypothetical protein
MATKRPAKISKKRTTTADKYCPVTGKPMSPVRMVSPQGGSKIMWMVIEDFDGSATQVERLIPVR